MQPFPKELAQNLEEWFQVELTYSSNALEGNTLSRQETALILEKGIAVGGKSLREHLEATNHAQALNFVKKLLHKNLIDINERDILKIHELILKGIDDAYASCYRNVSVRIMGSAVIFPNPVKVPLLMSHLMSWIKDNLHLHPVELACEVHYRLVTIHPLMDGNGGTARLLMNLFLRLCGYPSGIIRKEDRLTYITSLEKAQLGGEKKDFENIIFKSVNRSLDIYLKALQGKEQIKPQPGLLKIGELAQQAGETVSTLRHWIAQGLIDVDDILNSGYQIFSKDMVERYHLIKKLKKKRLTLKEISHEINKLKENL